MSRRTNVVLLSALAIVACKGVDRLLEGVPEPTNSRLTLAIETTNITIVRGAEQTFIATVTRSKDFAGQVAVVVDQLPDGVQATVAPGTTAGASTTSAVTLRATSSAQVGTFTILVRGRADQLPDASQSLTLTVVEQPNYSLALSPDALTIARGGIGRIGVRLTRANFTSPVTLSVQGVPGVTGSFGASPTAGDTATATLSVAASVAPGTYTATIRAVAEGLADRTTSVALTVAADPLQVIAPTTVTVTQGSITPTELIVNHGTVSGPVTLTAEGLPDGASATFEANGLTTTMRLVVQQSVAPTGYLMTIRATAAGVPDATARVSVIVNPSSIELSVAPSNVSVFQGGNTSSSATLARTAFSGAVTLAAENVPDGVTIAFQPPSITTSASAITVTASNAAVPGLYNIVVRATPTAGIGPTSAAPLTVTVRTAPVGNGNVFLDWSACTPPVWVASMDGAGPWTRAEIVSGAVRFTVNTVRGGFAYVDSDTAVTVRFMLRTELTAGPINMCPPVVPTKTVNGFSEHALINETATWSLGGATTTSSTATPNFTISGVRNGTHDLIGFSTTTRGGVRALIRRDQNVASGGSLAPVDLISNEAFGPLRPNIGITGGLVGEQFSYSMSYLTTAACVVNPLYTFAPFTNVMYGMPDSIQRADDYHLVTITATTPTASRSASTAFHYMSGNRNFALPVAPVAPAVTTLAAPFRRLNATFNSIPGPYNQSVSFAYRDGRHAMTASATIGYTGTGVVNLGIPDFSTVSGFPLAAAIPTSSTGKWTAGLDGVRTSGPLCSEGAGTLAWRLSGVF